ncbi:MAG: hypothetical protein EBT08_00915 [Betaproteobacteria bacterium]|jgi:hypothetical protein|nr:hypothetical protein [Betaproteobacteria bacterium]
MSLNFLARVGANGLINLRSSSQDDTASTACDKKPKLPPVLLNWESLRILDRAFKLDITDRLGRRSKFCQMGSRLPQPTYRAAAINS